MMLATKRLADILESDLQSLVDSQIAEGKLIDYKRELPGSSDAEKKEFLFDVSSFANASGGYLIYGISESHGLPKELTGVIPSDPDKELRRLQSLVLDGIEPRILGVDMRFVPINGSKYIFLITIPKSWNSPHMVVFQGTDKFYSRNAGGKHRLDVGELRALFNSNAVVAEKIRQFIVDRISKIIAEETPIHVGSGPKVILHVIPLASFSSPLQLNLSFCRQNTGDLIPLGGTGFNPSTNLDGLLHFYASTSPESGLYVQLFRNGVIETVNTELLRPWNNEKVVAGACLKSAITNAVVSYFKVLQKLEIPAPIIISLTLTGVKGFRMAMNGPVFIIRNQIDRDILSIPELFLERSTVSVSDLKPLFDLVWNAAGFAESPD